MTCEQPARVVTRKHCHIPRRTLNFRRLVWPYAVVDRLPQRLR